VYDTLVTLADESDQPWKLRGEADFHFAAMRLADGDREEALRGFERAYRSYDAETRYTFHALLIYRKMLWDEHWPTWIPDAGP
jgi:hypothetical protein